MNILDIAFALTILVLAGWGYYIGVIGAVIWLVTAYLSVVIGSQIVVRTIPLIGLSEEYASLVISFGFILISALIFQLARIASRGLRSAINLTPARFLNDVGGTILGALLGTLAVVAIIAVAATFTYVVPEDAVDLGNSSYASAFSQYYLNTEPRAWLDHQLTNSRFVQTLSNIQTLLIPIAPREVGLALEVLFWRAD